MIRSIISNLPIGRVQNEKRHVPVATQPTHSDPAKHMFALAKTSTSASYGSVKPKTPQSSAISKSIAFFEEQLKGYDIATLTDERSILNSSSIDKGTEAVIYIGTGDGDDNDSVSDLSFDALPTDPDELDPCTPSFSGKVYISEAWEKESYSLIRLEQQWFRLAKNSGFTAALYLQGLAEVLHTVRGIFSNHPEETLLLVFDDQKTVYKLDRTNYRQGITACCADALHTLPLDPEFQDVSLASSDE